MVTKTVMKKMIVDAMDAVSDTEIDPAAGRKQMAAAREHSTAALNLMLSYPPPSNGGKVNVRLSLLRLAALSRLRSPYSKVQKRSRVREMRHIFTGIWSRKRLIPYDLKVAAVLRNLKQHTRIVIISPLYFHN